MRLVAPEFYDVAGIAANFVIDRGESARISREKSVATIHTIGKVAGRFVRNSTEHGEKYVLFPFAIFLFFVA